MRDLFLSCFVVSVILSPAFSSCVDSRYRIDDIDTSITLAPGGIQIPLSSLGKKTLGEMFGDIEQLVADSETGYYSLRYSMSYDYNVPGISVDRTPSLSRVMDQIFVDGSEIGGGGSGGGTHGITGGAEISEQFRISETVRTIKNIIIKSAENLGANATMRITLNVENPLLETLYLDDFTLSLPGFLVISDARVDGGNVYRDQRVIIDAGGKSSFKQTLAELEITDLRNIPVDDNQIAALRGRFDFSATVCAPEGAEIDPGAPQMVITPEIEVSDIRLTSLEGELGFKLDDYISENIRPIELKSIFDAIGTGGNKDPDLAAPTVKLSITNPVGVRLSGSMIFDPKDRNGLSLGSVTADGLAINGSEDGEPYENLMYITDDASESVTGDYVPYDVETSRLVETIPYTIDLDIKASAVPDIDHLIDLDAGSYEFGLKLDVDIPLDFGENMDLTIERSAEVGKIFSKLADLGFKASEIGVGAELEVSFPFLFDNMGVMFVDSGGSAIPGLTTSVTGMIQGPVPGEDGGAKKSRLEIVLSVPENGDFQTLKAIESIEFSIPITGTGTLNRLNRDDYIEGKLWLMFPGGVSADLVKLLGED